MKTKYSHPRFKGRALGAKQKSAVEDWSEKSAAALARKQKGGRK